MSPSHDSVDLLRGLIARADTLLAKSNLTELDVEGLAYLSSEHIKRLFGKDSDYLRRFKDASGIAVRSLAEGGNDWPQVYRSRVEAKRKVLTACLTRLENERELALATLQPPPQPPTAHAPSAKKPKVFVVHGHDHRRKDDLSHFLRQIGLEPVILHEKPNGGSTVIEKFTRYADVNFAVVLLTADDEGRARSSNSMHLPRARQNVILELGYFLGSLGREKVCALYEPGVEIPSDYAGVLFIELDDSGAWKQGLAAELQEAEVSPILDPIQPMPKDA